MSGRAVVLGGAGMLARELEPALERVGYRVTRVPRAELDIAHAAAVQGLLEQLRPDLVANCAAYTKVDKAEQEVDQAFAVNARGAGNAARTARALGVPLVHVSTDYVFDGHKRQPYLESDACAPLGVYARSKRAGEEEVLAAGGRVFLVRTGELYGDGGRNFFDAVLRRARAGRALKVVSDQTITPTWTRELARQLATLAAQGSPGIYHATASGQVTWYDAAREALRICALDVPIEPVATEAYGSPAPRPLYTVLSKEKLQSLGLYVMRPWRECLEEWLRTRAGSA